MIFEDDADFALGKGSYSIELIATIKASILNVVKSSKDTRFITFHLRLSDVHLIVNLAFFEAWWQYNIMESVSWTYDINWFGIL